MTETTNKGYDIFDYVIADFHIRLRFSKDDKNSPLLISSFSPFLVTEEEAQVYPLLFRLTIDDKLRPRPKDERRRVRVFDNGNGKTAVDMLSDGGYQYIIKNIDEADCCLLISNKDFNDCHCALNGNYNMRCYGLNNALMLVFAFAGCARDAVLVHASLVRHCGRGYAFIAKSGTGKSTQVSMWLRHIPDCDLMNDDNPVVRIIDGKAWIYGSPWSGKTPCYRKVKAPLGAITRIDRASSNSVERLHGVEGFASVLPSFSMMKWDKNIFDRICRITARLAESTPTYILHCLPNREAAELCCKEIAKEA